MQLALLVGVVLARGDGARVADRFTAGEEAHWVVEIGGKPTGDHWSTYAGVVDLLGVQTHHFVAGLHTVHQGQLGPVEMRSNGELWTDDFGHPLRWLQRSEIAGTLISIDLVVKEGKGSAHVVKGPTASDLDVAVPPGAFLLANNFVSQLELVAALAPPTEGSPRQLELFSPDAMKAVPFELKHVGNFAQKPPPDAPEDAEIVEGEKYRDSLGEVLKMLPGGKLVELEVPAAALKYRRSDEPFEKVVVAAPTAPPKDFLREEVVVTHDRVTLAGTLTRRKGSSGRRPALFFVSGSGLQDREGMSGGVDLGTHELLDRLTEAGFLVLRVDDRGVGQSKGPLDGVTFDDLIADARACVDFLLARPDVDPKRVAVLGHSEGGETAPILACERPLAAIVLMAPPGRGIAAILHDQKKQGLEEAGLPAAMVASEMEVHAKFVELVCGDGPIDENTVRADYRPSLKERAWFHSHAVRDTLAQARQVKCPVLIAQGGKDFQVSPELDARPLLAAIKEGKNPDATLQVFPQLDHLFKKCAGEKSTMSDYLTARPVDPEFLEAVTAWLTARLKP